MTKTKTEQELKKELRRSLAKLGNSPTRIAKRLQSLNIQGRRDEPRDCPLAIYLEKELGVNSYPHVDGASIALDVTGSSVEIPTRKALNQFVTKFDAGAYPELELPDYP